MLWTKTQKICSGKTKAAERADLTFDPVEFVEDWGHEDFTAETEKSLQHIDLPDSVSQKEVSPTASVASSEDIKSAVRADLTSDPLESMDVADKTVTPEGGEDRLIESNRITGIDAAPVPSGAENVNGSFMIKTPDAVQEVMGNEVGEITDSFLCDTPNLECDLMLPDTSQESGSGISESNAPAVCAKKEDTGRERDSTCTGFRVRNGRGRERPAQLTPQT